MDVAVYLDSPFGVDAPSPIKLAHIVMFIEKWVSYK